MTDREKQIEAWILKAKDQILIDYDHYEPATLYLDHALNLLQEPCPTCGGSKEVRPKHIRSAHEALPYMIPCPKCQSQEPAKPVSELTDADVISIYEAQCWPANENKIKEWKKWGKDMCVRLEAANKRADEAERKENSSQAMIKRLRKAIKQLTIQLEAAKCVNEMLKEKGIG